MSTEDKRPTREECIRDAARVMVRGLALYTNQVPAKESPERRRPDKAA